MLPRFKPCDLATQLGKVELDPLVFGAQVGSRRGDGQVVAHQSPARFSGEQLVERDAVSA